MSERKQRELHRRKRQVHTDKTLALLNKLIAQDATIQQQAQRIAELEAELDAQHHPSGLHDVPAVAASRVSSERSPLP